MDNRKMCIDKIQEAIDNEKYEKHSNEWNVANQLIDIAAINPEAAGIIFEDLDNEELSVKKTVEKIVRKRISGSEIVMQELCKIYAVPLPEMLPPEFWRSPNLNDGDSNDSGKKLNVDLFDLL